MSEPEAVVSEHVDLRLRIGPVWLDPHAIIYATIILMTTYTLYDEGTDPLGKGPFLELVAVSVAPLFALGMAHAFSDALDIQIRFQRRLTGHDRRHVLAKNVQFLYVAIPPIVLMAVLTLIGWDANDAVSFAQVLGLASLFFWGTYAGRKAGLGVLKQVRFGISYSLMGLVVILVELAITH